MAAVGRAQDGDGGENGSEGHGEDHADAAEEDRSVVDAERVRMRGEVRPTCCYLGADAFRPLAFYVLNCCDHFREAEWMLRVLSEYSLAAQSAVAKVIDLISKRFERRPRGAVKSACERVRRFCGRVVFQNKCAVVQHKGAARSFTSSAILLGRQQDSDTRSSKMPHESRRIVDDEVFISKLVSDRSRWLCEAVWRLKPTTRAGHVEMNASPPKQDIEAQLKATRPGNVFAPLMHPEL